jgi:cephalosporin hydroxylase
MSSGTLKDLFARHAHTECTHGTDKDTVHSYGDTYDTLCAPMKDSITDILEIGFCSGASAEAFADYFENARVVALDITDRHLRFGKEHPRITFAAIDATSWKAVAQVRAMGVDAFDLIVDDGSHFPNHQFMAFDFFMPMLRPGGMYIIEDVNLTDHPDLAMHFEDKAGHHGATFSLIDLRPASGRFDDVLLVFTKIP